MTTVHRQPETPEPTQEENLIKLTNFQENFRQKSKEHQSKKENFHSTLYDMVDTKRNSNYFAANAGVYCHNVKLSTLFCFVFVVFGLLY